MYYAQINNGVVAAVTQTAGPIDAPHMIEIDDMLDIAGYTYDPETGEFSPPAAPPPPAPPVWEWYIDKGPFFDRFGAAKMAVLTSTDSTIKALLADINNRHWIDLQRTDVAQAVGYIGSVIPAVNATLQASILTSPVTETENLALRKLFFGA